MAGGTPLHGHVRGVTGWEESGLLLTDSRGSGPATSSLPNLVTGATLWLRPSLGLHSPIRADLRQAHPDVTIRRPLDRASSGSLRLGVCLHHLTGRPGLTARPVLPCPRSGRATTQTPTCARIPRHHPTAGMVIGASKILRIFLLQASPPRRGTVPPRFRLER